MKTKPYDQYDYVAMGLLTAILAIVMLCFSTCSPAQAEGIDVDRVVYAIGKAENSIKYPYGIKSINTHGDKVLARKICQNTVVNNIKRYEALGNHAESAKILDFLRFLGQRYCPTSGNITSLETALNRNWVKNVYYFYQRGV